MVNKVASPILPRRSDPIALQLDRVHKHLRHGYNQTEPERRRYSALQIVQQYGLSGRRLRRQPKPHPKLHIQAASVWSMQKDPDLEKALKRNNRWTVNNKLKTILQLCADQSASIQHLQKRVQKLPFSVNVHNWVKKYPCFFELYTYNFETWCRMSKKLRLYVEEEESVKIQLEPALTQKLVKILMLSRGRRLNVVKFVDLRKSFGFSEDYLISIVAKNADLFRVLEYEGKRTRMEIELVEWNKDLAVSAIQMNKCAGEFQCRLPESWKKSRERFEEFQKIRYVSPYIDGLKGLESLEGLNEMEREKWVVGVIHELLSLTLWKRMSIAKLVKFSREFRLPNDLVRLLLRHPGIFYVSNKNDVHTAVLRDAYAGSELIVKDPLVIVKEKFFDIMQGGLYELNESRRIANLQRRKANKPFWKINAVMPKDK